MIFNDNLRYQISVTLTGDTEIQALNKKFKGKDEPTDVLSFIHNKNLDEGEYYIGDIIVNREQAKRQAKDYDNSLEQEIAALVEHGVLHLLGVHHGDDK